MSFGTYMSSGLEVKDLESARGLEPTLEPNI